MRVLMLGNSFTFCKQHARNPGQLNRSEVVQHTRGGATSCRAVES